MERTKSISWKKAGKIAAGLISGYALWFLFLIIALVWVNPPFTAFTLQEDWIRLDKERYNLRTEWVDNPDIPNHMKWAVIASEDQRFYEHSGLDLEAIETAVKEYKRGEDLRGASTITQQVAKNLFLWPAQSYLRKGIEAGIAVTIDFIWPKDRIMEVYLNIAEFGPGLYGIGKASKELYGRDASQLQPVESARLATVLPNPKRMRAAPPSPFVEERSLWVLRQIRQLTGMNYNLPAPSENHTRPDLAAETDQLNRPEPDSASELTPDTLIRRIKPDSVYSVQVSDSLKAGN